MQEEVEQRVVTLIVNCSKLTEQELRKALSKLLAQMKNHRQNKQPHGKMTVKQLAAQNRGMQSVEVTDQNIGSFTRIARKYGIDFAPFKAKDQDRYLIFFKSQDADAMTAAFKEYMPFSVSRKGCSSSSWTRSSPRPARALSEETTKCTPISSSSAMT